MTLDDHIFKDVFLGPYSSFNSPLTPVSKMVSVVFMCCKNGIFIHRKNGTVYK